MSSNRYMMFKSTTSISVVACFLLGQAVRADEGHCCIDWNKLNLTPTQSQQIHGLEAQWNQSYSEIKPSILEDQAKLQRLLADHTSDPVEIMALQQTIARKKEQLNALATANYLKKRQLLNDNQQEHLEFMVRQVVASRQRGMSPASQTEVMPDRVQDLIQKVRNIWPVQQER